MSQPPQAAQADTHPDSTCLILQANACQSRAGNGVENEQASSSESVPAPKLPLKGPEDGAAVSKPICQDVVTFTDYRPLALRWQFVSALVIYLAILSGLLVHAWNTLPIQHYGESSTALKRRSDFVTLPMHITAYPWKDQVSTATFPVFSSPTVHGVNNAPSSSVAPLPGQPTTVTTMSTQFSKRASVGCDKFYTVKEGDTCQPIADGNGITLQQFFQWNPTINSNCQNLMPGQNVCVHLSSPPNQTPVATARTSFSTIAGPTTVNGCITYVQAGHTASFCCTSDDGLLPSVHCNTLSPTPTCSGTCGISKDWAASTGTHTLSESCSSDATGYGCVAMNKRSLTSDLITPTATIAPVSAIQTSTACTSDASGIGCWAYPLPRVPTRPLVALSLPVATGNSRKLMPRVGSETPTDVGSPSTLSTAYKTASFTRATQAALPSNETGWIVTTVYYISPSEYFVGMFLPVLLATLLVIPVRIIDLNARLFQPFYEMAYPGGSLGSDSMLLETSGWRCWWVPSRFLRQKQCLLLLTLVLKLSSMLVVTFASAAVGIDMVGSCRQDEPWTSKSCALVLTAFDKPVIAVLSLLAFMIATTLLIIVVLSDWKTGVHTNPWSISELARLSSSHGLKAILSGFTHGKDSVERAQLRSTTFVIRNYISSDNEEQYEIQALKGQATATLCLGDRPDNPSERTLAQPLESALKHVEMDQAVESAGRAKATPFVVLSKGGRGFFLAFIAGVMGVIIYYHNTPPYDDGFEHFMDDGSLAVSCVFTGIGALVTCFWASFNESISLLSPHHYSATSKHPNPRALNKSRPTNPLSSAYMAILHRHYFLFTVSVLALFSEVLPIFLTNVPYRQQETYDLWQQCYFVTVAILSAMMLTLAWSFFIKWTPLPVDPSTLAGAMYCVLETDLPAQQLADLEIADGTTLPPHFGPAN